MKTPQAFGQYFKDLRVKQGLTLRQFCLSNGFDPGNISKLERGILTPHSKDKLSEYATALGLKEGSDAWIEFFDLAAVAGGMLSHITSEALIKRVPLLFRTLDNKDLDESKLDKLIELIKKS